MRIIEKILSRPEFEKTPPVLVDIGASGGIHPAWKRIRKHAICIAFDGDEAGLRRIPSAVTSYKKLCLYNLVVTPNESGEADFYITRSAACSSLLPPRNKQLSDWVFADRFEVVEKRRVKTGTLTNILKEIGVQRVDWFKTDSQGTDLRLFESLGNDLINRVLVAEFEPGIIDAYEGEDKLWQVMSFMESRPFWMSDIDIKGSQWLRKDLRDSFTRVEKPLLGQLLKRSPGWGEVAYLNTLSGPEFALRDYLLGAVFSLLKGQYGFALHLARRGRERFGEDIFDRVRSHALSAIRWSYLNPSTHFDVLQRVVARLARNAG